MISIWHINIDRKNQGVGWINSRQSDSDIKKQDKNIRYR